ncbi:MAG: hypothetical protein IJL57_06260 [Bacteroidales bacterium]|nr:hypothetical protein [Bacteroidales bacterium]
METPLAPIVPITGLQLVEYRNFLTSGEEPEATIYTLSSLFSNIESPKGSCQGISEKPLI